MLALYRKYRPQTFAEVIGQDHIKLTLKSEIQNECLAHAFLFCGPRGIGKTSLARILAKAVNCSEMSKEGEPCNECSECIEINSGRSLDIIEMDAASHTKVDEVRESIIANSKIIAVSKRFKVFIIDEVHMLSISSFNALLKTLEEPPKNVIFVLATTEVHKIPDTIISRCQRFDFKRVSADALLDRLREITEKEGKKADDDVLKRVARISGGYVRDALSLLGQVLALPKNEIMADDADLVLPKSNLDKILILLGFLEENKIKEAVGIANEVTENGRDIGLFMEELVEVLRRILLVSIEADLLLDFSASDQENIKTLSTNLGRMRTMRMINVFIQKRDLLSKTDIEQLPLELGIVEVCGVVSSSQKTTGGGYLGSHLSKEVPASEGKVVSETPQDGRIKTSGKKIIQEIKAIKDKTKDIIKSSVSIGSKVSEEIVESVLTGGGIDFVQIEKKWIEVLEMLKESNLSTFMLLKNARLDGFENNKVQIAFKFAFHKEKMATTDNIDLMLDIFQKVYGQKISLDPVVDENLEFNTATNSSTEGKIALDGLLDSFGGRVVE